MLLKVNKPRAGLGLFLAAAIGVFGASQAFAAAVLTTSSGGFGGSVTDNGAGDFDATEGVVLVTGAVGDWNVNVNTGLTKPLTGSSQWADMDLNSVALSTFGTSDSLTVEFWDFDFTNTTGGVFSTAIGGTVQNASISWMACIDGANGQACSDTITLGDFDPSVGPGLPLAFSASTPYAYFRDGSADPFAIGLIATITPDDETAQSLVSFDFQVSQVPVPAAAWLFGSALFGLIAISRRRKA